MNLSFYSILNRLRLRSIKSHKLRYVIVLEHYSSKKRADNFSKIALAMDNYKNKSVFEMSFYGFKKFT